MTIQQGMAYMRLAAIATILGVLVYVALSPNVVYAPVPRAILYLISSVFLATLIGVEATTQFRFRLPGFLFVTGGTAAVALFTLMLLTHLSKPDRQIVVFEVVDEAGEKVNLSVYGALDFERHSSGLVPTVFYGGSSAALIFPEQLAEQTILIRTLTDGKSYKGVVSYAKPPVGALKLGIDLK